MRMIYTVAIDTNTIPRTGGNNLLGSERVDKLETPVRSRKFFGVPSSGQKYG